MTDIRQATNELNAFWDAFCDADPIPDYDGFVSRMEQAGFIELRPVTGRDLEDPFAAERGIEKGGMIWCLTSSGMAARLSAA